jgi:hypothetical protein
MGYFHTWIGAGWVAAKRLYLRVLRRMDMWWSLGRPMLEYVETHLVDQCNMNCLGCSHFSPLAEPWFADLDTFRHDLEALARLFRGVRVIRLMGGEPLLHKEADQFLACARRVFPRARIQLVTNGILLADMPERFWTACRENRIFLKLTVYPPMKAHAETCVALCRKHDIRLVMTQTEHFCIWLNPDGDSSPVESFRRCRRALYCPILKDGRLYVCATAAYIGLFNRGFGLNLPQMEGFALNAEGLTGKRLLRALDNPVELCRWCAMEKGTMVWDNGRPVADDWFVVGHSGRKGMNVRNPR